MKKKKTRFLFLSIIQGGGGGGGRPNVSKSVSRESCRPRVAERGRGSRKSRIIERGEEGGGENRIGERFVAEASFNWAKVNSPTIWHSSKEWGNNRFSLFHTRSNPSKLTPSQEFEDSLKKN